MTARAAHACVAALFAAGAPAQIAWTDAAALRLEGKAWADTAAPYDRLPARAEELVPAPVWRLSRCASGMCVGFRTDASEIHARWTLTSDRLAMPHMAATGVSGVDLYVRHQGAWRWLAVGKPTEPGANHARLIAGLPRAEREYLLYLPLYNGVSSVAVGVPEGSAVADSAPRAPRTAIVFYGTSITMGGCASRPGMCHTAILGRRLDRPVVNLGFSGNGRMELALAELLAELEPAVYVLDCLPNMDAEQIHARVVPFVKTLRAARPDVPILLVEDRTYQDAFLSASRAERNASNRTALRAELAELEREGVRGLHFLAGDDLLGDDGEATVDGSHPTDLGFVRQADALEAALRVILERTR